MTNKLSLRLKLSDFINSEFESEIMEKIKALPKESLLQQPEPKSLLDK